MKKIGQKLSLGDYRSGQSTLPKMKEIWKVVVNLLCEQNTAIWKIKYLTFKIQLRGRGQGQNRWPHLCPIVQSICCPLILNIWKFKVTVMAKIDKGLMKQSTCQGHRYCPKRKKKHEKVCGIYYVNKNLLSVVESAAAAASTAVAY